MVFIPSSFLVVPTLSWGSDILRPEAHPLGGLFAQEMRRARPDLVPPFCEAHIAPDLHVGEPRLAHNAVTTHTTEGVD